MAAPLKKLQAKSQEEYEASAADLYGKLREAWERAIEEVLLQDVIQRFRPSVETQRLKKVMIENVDYPLVEREMGKCSTWMTGHDSAAAIGSPFPTPTEIDQDIVKLETFVKDVRAREKKASDAADAILDPPQPQVSTTRASKVIDMASPAAPTSLDPVRESPLLPLPHDHGVVATCIAPSLPEEADCFAVLLVSVQNPNVSHNAFYARMVSERPPRLRWIVTTSSFGPTVNSETSSPGYPRSSPPRVSTPPGSSSSSSPPISAIGTLESTFRG